MLLTVEEVQKVDEFVRNVIALRTVSSAAELHPHAAFEPQSGAAHELSIPVLRDFEDFTRSFGVASLLLACPALVPSTSTFAISGCPQRVSSPEML